MELIDKSALIAELEKRIEEGENVAKELPSSAIMGLTQAYKNVLSFLDTLEVKEVNLEKEIDAWYQKPPKEFENIEECAKHFFELGLKVKEE